VAALGVPGRGEWRRGGGKGEEGAGEVFGARYGDFAGEAAAPSSPSPLASKATLVAGAWRGGERGARGRGGGGGGAVLGETPPPSTAALSRARVRSLRRAPLRVRVRGGSPALGGGPCPEARGAEGGRPGRGVKKLPLCLPWDASASLPPPLRRKAWIQGVQGGGVGGGNGRKGRRGAAAFAPVPPPPPPRP